MEKHRKIYYVPGMISLLALPIVCYFYLKPFLRDERSLEIVLPEKVQNRESYKATFHFDTSFLSQPSTFRMYRTIILNGNNDDQKLDSFHIGIHKMISSKDSLTGMHLLFVDKVKYRTFIRSINICKQDSLFYFTTFENHLWTFYKPLNKDFIERINQRRLDSKIKNRKDLISRSIDNTTFKDRIKSISMVLLIFAILFILCYVSMNKMRKN